MKNPRLNTPNRNIILPISRRLIPILPHPRPNPIPSRDLLRLFPFRKEPFPSKQRTIHSPQIQMISRPHKIHHSQSINMRLVRRGSHNPVYATFQKPVGPELQRVRNVHGDTTRVGLYVFPLASGCFDLQCSDRLSE